MPSDRDSLRSPVTVALREEADDAEWDDLLASDPRATAFHSSPMHRAAARHTPGWSARWLEARRDARLVAGLPLMLRRRWGLEDWVSGMGGGYGGPVALPDAEEAEAALGRAFVRLGGWRRRHLELVWAGRRPPRGTWKGIGELSTAVLDVDADRDFDQLLLDRLPMNRRNECNRSDRRGLRVEVDESGQWLSDFHRIYRARCEQWKSPAVAEGYLREMLEQRPEARLFAVLTDEDRLVGAHLCVHLPGQLFAWVGTTERMKGVFPSSLVVREELRWCHRQRVEQLNLGSSLGIEGVRNFKRLVGARDDPRWILREQARWTRWLRR